MTARTPTYLKARWENGDIPQGTDYEDLFDSYINVVVSAEQSIDSNLRTTKQLVAASVSAATGSFASLTAPSTLNINAPAISVSGGTVGLNGTAVTVSALTFADYCTTRTQSTDGSFTQTVGVNYTLDTGSNLRLNCAGPISVSSQSVVGITGTNISLLGNILVSAEDVSAVATTQAGAVTLNGTMNFVVFADGGNNAVKLPTSSKGRIQMVINASTTVLKIFPSTSARFLVTAVNASLNIPADRTAMVFHKGDGRYGISIA
jgi:hypothetical protein